MKPIISNPGSVKAETFTSLLKGVTQTQAIAAENNRNRKLSVEETRLTREDAHKAGYRDGFEAGHREGLEKGYAEISVEVQEFAGALDAKFKEFERAIQDWYVASEQRMSELSLLIAAKLLSKQLELAPEFVLATVREALSELASSETLKIRINPFDLPILEKHRAELVSIVPSLKSIDLVTDGAISSGCLIESDGALVDVTLDTKLDTILAALQNRSIAAPSAKPKKKRVKADIVELKEAA